VKERKGKGKKRDEYRGWKTPSISFSKREKKERRY